jgi:short subunit dehydrogenase-like uncharacterized protein
MIAKYHELAKKNHTIIIPECGLDSVPADIMAYVLAKAVRKRFNAACERAIMTLYDFKTGFSGGTALTGLELCQKYSLSHLAKSMHPYSLSPVKADQVVATPTGSFPYNLFGLKSIPELGGIQTTGVMASVDECIAHRSWGLYQSSGDKSLQYGPKFRFNEYARAPNFFLGFAQKATLASLAILVAIPVTRWFLAPLLKTFVIPSPGSGPTRESMKNDFMHYRGVGIAEDGKGKVMANLEVAHGAYITTAITLSAAAQVILRGRLEDTEASKFGGGILTPATLGDQYVKTLNEFGMKIRVDE